MKKISTLNELTQEIKELQEKRSQLGIELKTRFSESLENIFPVSKIKGNLSDLLTGGNVKSTLISTLIKISGAYLAKKMGSETNGEQIKKMTGLFLQVNSPKIILQSNPLPEKPAPDSEI